jgi:glycosyltransferase involved in cell wall biosynthesis
MRVLYSFPHPIGAPGIGTTAMQQVLGLLERKHDVTVMSTSLHPRGTQVPKLKLTMTVAGLRVPHRLLGMDNAKAYHDACVAAHLRRHATDYDVVHAWPGAVVKTAQAAARAGVPLLREVPNTHTENAYAVVEDLCRQLQIQLRRGNSHRSNPARLARERTDYECAFRLLVPSEHVADTFLDRGFAPEKLLRHRYGFDPRRFTPGTAKLEGPLRAVFLGSVGARKGVHLALEAWSRSQASRDGRFAIYGAIDPGYEGVIQPYLEQPGIELHSFTSDANVVLQASDVLLLPSYEEGSALVTYEAQGCGVVPLVSSAAGAMCQPEVTGLVHSVGDVDGLVSHLDLLHNDPQRLATMRSAVLSGRDELTWASAAARLEACYEDARAAMSGRREAA